MRTNTLASILVPVVGIAALAGVVLLKTGPWSTTPGAGFGNANTGPASDAGAETGLAGAVVRWESVSGLPKQLAICETVFWEPRDTTSLRQLILGSSLVKGKSVLEIGTGSGLLSLCCLEAGARSVVATDVNRIAIANAAFNAEQFGRKDRLDLRLVSLDDLEAFSVIEETERFDLIISNPPWENEKPTTIDSYALYDRDFRLLKSLLVQLPDHLEPGGKALLAYGCVSAIRTMQDLAEEHDLELGVLDDRDLDSLPELFLPGMLLEVRPKNDAPDVPGPERSCGF